MSPLDIIRAWKDEDYRMSLSAAERALVPDNPAGLIELAGTELVDVVGGAPPRPTFYAGCKTYTCTIAFCKFTTKVLTC